MAFRQFTPDEWSEEINSGLDFRRKFGIEGTWSDLESMYYNVHRSMANDGPNVIMSTTDALLSTLTVPNPSVIVKPENPDSVNRAPLVEALDNVLLRELRMREEVDTAVLHAILFGVGIVKIGFDSEFGFDPTLDIGGVLRFGYTLSQFDKSGKRRLESDSGVSPGMPWVRAVDPRDIVVPWGTHRLSSSPWITHRFVRHIDDMQADRKYSNTSRLIPTMSMEDFVTSYNSTMRLWRPSSPTTSTGVRSRRYTHSKRGSREIEYVEVHEIHDRRTGRILAISPGYDKFLRNDKNALQIDGTLPFTSISFTPKARSFWTTSDAYYLQAIQMEISDVAVQRTKIRRLAVLKFIVDKNVIDEQELEKLLSPDAGAYAWINGGEDLNKAIIKFETHPDQSLILEEEHLRRNAREQIGFSRNQLGEFAGGRRTATEAGIVQDASQLRMTRRGLAVKRLYEDIISVVNGIIFTHWQQPRYIEVLGPQQAETWQRMTGASLKGRYSYNIDFVDEAVHKQRRLEAIQLYAMLIQDPSVDPAALRRYISDQFGDPSFTRIFNADIQNAMQAMRLAGGLVQPDSLNIQTGAAPGRPTGLDGRGSSVSGSSQANGQGGSTSSQTRQLAQGRTST